MRADFWKNLAIYTKEFIHFYIQSNTTEHQIFLIHLAE